MTTMSSRIVRRIGRLGWTVGSACLAFAAAASSHPESRYAARQGFAFALLGNAPLHASTEGIVSQVLAELATEVDLAIHTGNVKGPDEHCDDETYMRRHALLDASPVPLVLTPGENDWASCDRKAAGQYGPVERLNRLRELFFEPGDSLGRLRLDVQRQSETVRFRGYPENARWEYGGILFVTVNVPGNRNNYRTGAGRNGEYEERVQANASWLRQAFAAAARLKTRGVVVAFAGDPHFEGREKTPGIDPYAQVKADLARLASKYSGPVLVVHGGEAPPNHHTPDRPVKLNGKTLQNVIRVRTYGYSRPAYWTKVSVLPGNRQVFSVETVNTVLTPPQPR